MADYYPLIARAVAGLEKNTGDARRALYERARTALVAQLRSVNPPLSENDVTRERLALEESIRKVEAEAARKTWVDPANGAAPTRVRAPEFPRWDPPPASAAPDDDEQSPRQATARLREHAPQPRESANGRQPTTARSLRSPSPAPAPAASAPNSMLGGERYVDPVFDQPLPSEQAPNMPPRTGDRASAKAGSPFASRLRAQEFPRRRLRKRRGQRSAAARREGRPAPRQRRRAAGVTRLRPHRHPFLRSARRAAFGLSGAADAGAGPGLRRSRDRCRPRRGRAARPWSAPRGGRSASTSGSRSRS